MQFLHVTDSFPFQQKLQTAHLFSASNKTPESHLANVTGTAQRITFVHILFALFHNVQELLLSSSLELHLLRRSYSTAFSCASPSLSCIFILLLGIFLNSSWWEIQKQLISCCSPNPLSGAQSHPLCPSTYLFL